jgi:hypothetical protein
MLEGRHDGISIAMFALWRETPVAATANGKDAALSLDAKGRPLITQAAP